MFYAIPTKGKCKCCGRRFGYLTVKHKVLIASEKNKDLLTECFGINADALVDADLILLKKMNIPWIEIQQALDQSSYDRAKNI